MKKKICLVVASLCFVTLPIAKVRTETPIFLTQRETESRNLAPLLKATANIIASDRHSIESTMQISGETPGMEMRSNAKIKTVVESPSRFSSQITFVSPKGLEGKKYEVVSDGSRVLIHDLTNRLYSVISYEEFMASSDDFLLGMVASLYLSIRRRENASTEAEYLRNLSESEAESLLKESFDLDTDEVETRIETIDEINYQAYKIADSKSGYTFDVLLEPDTEAIHSLTVYGKSRGLNIILQEEYEFLTQPKNIRETTFRFLPPINSTEARQTVEIEPF